MSDAFLNCGAKCVAHALGTVAILAASASAHPQRAAVVHGTFELPEVSAATVIGSRLLLFADDVAADDGGGAFRAAVLLDDALERLSAGGSIVPEPSEHVYRRLLEKLSGSSSDTPDPDLMTDVEDMTIAPNGDVVIVTSHSLSKNGKRPLKRQRVVRARVLPSGEIERADMSTYSILDALPTELDASKLRRPGESTGQAGFNIEGVSMEPAGRLLLGLRSPLIDEKALVLGIADHARVFEVGPKDANPKVTVDARLDLRGSGIRGMSYDAHDKGHWLLAGLARDADDEPKPTNDWSIWFWNGSDEPTCRFRRDDRSGAARLQDPEAICVITRPGAERFLLVISDDGARAPSHYALIPLPSAH